MMVALRIIHIGGGVFWAGSLMFLAFYLGPAVRRAGPGGGQVMQELAKARLMQVMPVVALLTILSGLWLMWILSAGFGAAFFRSGYGVSLTIGGAAALAAYLIGMLRMRPTQARMAELGPRLAAATDEAERGRLGAELAALQARVGRLSLGTALLLIVSVLTMAVARYI